MKIKVGDLLVWCAVEVCMYPPRKLNVVLWRKLKPPVGWKKSRYTPGAGNPVGFRPINPLITPMLTQKEIEVLHAKLCLIQEREAA